MLKNAAHDSSWAVFLSSFIKKKQRLHNALEVSRVEHKQKINKKLAKAK